MPGKGYARDDDTDDKQREIQLQPFNFFFGFGFIFFFHIENFVAASQRAVGPEYYRRGVYG